MAFVTSKDGTQIGYSVIGAGPAIVLVDGALCWRASGPCCPGAAGTLEAIASIGR